ncbi:hypothetical protein Cgig2_017884 [Carnegiea gigantea]|uniref:Uncharacterized protein n=1 Tax=Carnegiea gigantea TaxID=171969 RepID=A0A9Q1Q9U8_9CARY|nr:hypothetical protein Cgig2_017884 [Carnegiea gigantea]
MESYREHVLLHMYDLWTNRRSDLKRYNITKPKRTLQQAFDHIPKGGMALVDYRDLFKRPTQGFKKASTRNFVNRANYKKARLHRTGSKPYRQVAWELSKQKMKIFGIVWSLLKPKCESSRIGFPSGYCPYAATALQNDGIVLSFVNDDRTNAAATLKLQQLRETLNSTKPHYIRWIHEDVGSSVQVLVLFHYLATRCEIISFSLCFWPTFYVFGHQI